LKYSPKLVVNARSKLCQGPYQQFYNGENHRLMLMLLACFNLSSVASDDQIHEATTSIEFCWLR